MNIQIDQFLLLFCDHMLIRNKLGIVVSNDKKEKQKKKKNVAMNLITFGCPLENP